MKSTYFNKIIHEETFEVDESYCDTVDKLMQQSGICYTTDCNGNKLRFVCYDDGKIYVDNDISRERRYRTYSLRGEVLEENGKTVVKIYYIYSRDDLVGDYISIAFSIISIIALCVFGFLTKELFTIKGTVLIAFAILSTFAAFKTQRGESTNKNADLEIMRNEVVKRIEAIKRWDE